ncbi:MAG: radical SAM/SPASM domain-containing protein [Candidatus Aenigmatarchaeota archaeon]
MQVAIINITKACPLKCPGCYYYTFYNKKNAHIKLNDYKKIINRLSENNGWKRIELSGGEPFLHPKLFEMVKYTYKKIIRPIVFTSGVINNRNKIRKLKPYIDSFNVTIKYPDKMDDGFKGMPGALEDALKFLKICYKLRILTNIHWTVDNFNYGCFEEMYDIAKKFSSKLIMLRYLPFSKEMMPRYLKEKYWESIVEYALKYENVHIGFPSYQTTYNYCVAGITRLAISVDGEVSPCIYLNNSVGNILNLSWKEIKRRLLVWRKNYKAKIKCIAEEKCLGGIL